MQLQAKLQEIAEIRDLDESKQQARYCLRYLVVSK